MKTRTIVFLIIIVIALIGMYRQSAINSTQATGSAPVYYQVSE